MTLLHSLILALATLGVGQDAGETDDGPGERVILHIGRDQIVMGHVTLEDNDVIVVRHLNEQLESYSKTRLLKIIRLVEPEPGQMGVVILNGGQKRVGVIVEDTFDHVIVNIDGIRTKLVREAVDYVILRPTFDQQFENYKLSARTPRQRLQLCQWLVDLRRYELASEQLAELIGDHPEPDAIKLLNVVKAQLAMSHKKPPPEPVETGNGNDETVLPAQILSPADVNLIRVYEIDFDRPPQVAVDPSTIRTMIELYGTSSVIPASERDRRALYRADSIEIVEVLFTLKARNLYPDVNVITEPYALNLFRRRVHNAWLLNTCATARCHGGVDAGRFFLHRRRHKDERVRYTNLLILERLEMDPQWPLVNYDEPMMSLIVQYGLPRHLARQPHPDVSGWKPVFGRGGQRLLRDTVTWIESMMQPRPDYPVDFEPPRLGRINESDTGLGEGVERAPR
jgi:hypothetical protein